MSRGRPALHVVPPLPAQEEAATSSLDPELTFRRYAPYVAAIAHRLLGREHDVDDTVQEVFVVAVRGLGRVRDPGAVKGWLASITVRVARRRLRTRRLKGLLGLEESATGEHLVDDAATPEQRTLVGRVYEVLDTLPADLRIAWVLRHVEGEKLEAVAELSGCSLATAKRRIARAHGLLQEALGDD